MVWLALATLVAIGAAEADYRIDRLRHPCPDNGMMPLRKLDREVALAMINNARPLREKDKFFSFDIGSLLVGGQLANRSTEYGYGDTIIAQCNINPPHEDLWVECAIEDSEARIIDSSGQCVTRDSLWANFRYQTGNQNGSRRLLDGPEKCRKRNFSPPVQTEWRSRFAATDATDADELSRYFWSLPRQRANCQKPISPLSAGVP